ncbi:hypothetical protein F4819DRAFT_501571 [Hypoxylon fuscum]|nr:hypothetical protein F4819DRAFT_501571 [Hypoxylon fuscum]
MSDTPKQQQKCDVCGKGRDDGVIIQICGRCKSRSFCGTACQRRDWPSHKEDCRSKAAEAEAANGKAWYDRNRKCEDGTSHFGQLELITWSGFQSEISEELGWGNCVASESAELKRKYEEQFKSDDTRMYRYWPQGFRWTCCGLAGDQRAGPLPDSIYRKDKIERRGLTLSRGPDKRSFNPGKGQIADAARAFLGMPM